MKDFLVYTSLRILLFVVCYAVFAGIWSLIWGSSGAAYIWPFVAAAIVSSLLSLKYLKGPRDRFANRVEQRAARATAKFEELRSREDADQEV